MNASRSILTFGLSFLVYSLVLSPCETSARTTEYLNQPRYLENPSMANAYNQVLADLHDLEAMLMEGDVEADQMMSILSKKEDANDDLLPRYPYRIKKNYNLDHLARMNFKRYDSSMSDKRVHPSKFNHRHMLGGLRKK